MNCTQDYYVFPNLNETPSTGVLILRSFESVYTPVHPFLLIFTSLFSLVSNELILIVLSRREMRKSGINVTMMCIAIMDFGFSAFAIIKTVFDREGKKGSWIHALLQILYTQWSIAFHAASLLLAVAMAFCRVMALRKAGKNKFWNSPRCSLRISVAIFIFSFLFTVFVPFSMRITQVDKNVYEVGAEPLFIANNCFWVKTVQAAYAVMLKGFPCVSMSILSLILICKVSDGKKSRASTKHNNSSTESVKQMNRSSRLIIGVLIVFLITEIPQMCGSLFASLFYVDYSRYIFPALGDFTYLLALLNSSVAFVIYSTLSSTFRKTFSRIFFPRSLHTNLFKNQKVTQVSGRSNSLPGPKMSQ